MSNEQMPEMTNKVIEREKTLAGMRKIIAKKMTESLANAPQATVTSRGDLSALAKVKKAYLDKGSKVSYTDLFIKIAAFAIEKYPIVNSALLDKKLIQYRSINIGVAVGMEQGLYVPVIKNVQNKTLLEVSNELKEIVERVKAGNATAADFSDGTFTLTNLGMFGIDQMTPILNWPESAILGIGATRKRLIVDDDDTIHIKPITTLSISHSHAVMDGYHCAKYLETFRNIMENPDSYFQNFD